MKYVKLLLLHKKYFKPFNCVPKKGLRLVLKCYQHNEFTNHIYLTLMYKQNLAFNYK